MNLPPQLEAKFSVAAGALSRKAFRADSHAAVCAGPVRLRQRRNDRRNRRGGWS